MQHRDGESYYEVVCACGRTNRPHAAKFQCECGRFVEIEWPARYGQERDHHD